MATDTKKPVAKRAPSPAKIKDQEAKARAKAIADKPYKKGDKITYTARAHDGDGSFDGYEDSQRGKWVRIVSTTEGILRLRPSQIKRAV